MDQAIEAWIGPHDPPEQVIWRPPLELSSTRLEGIARQLRAAKAVERVVIGGRPALKIRGHDGSASTSVLSADEIGLVLAASGRVAPL